MNELTNKFWNEHFRNKNRLELSKIKQKVYDWLNEDNFGGFGIDNNIFWIEKTCTLASSPNYIYYYIIKWAKRQEYTYLYELPEREGVKWQVNLKIICLVYWKNYLDLKTQ